MNKLEIKMGAKMLSNLIAGLGHQHQDVLIQNIVDDTRYLKAGDAFLCLPRANNIQMLMEQAQEKGALAILFVGHAEMKSDVAYAHLPDMQAAGAMLRRWFETESVVIPCIGITGTDGKTSTAWMLREALAVQLGSVWSCGTLGLIRDVDDRLELGNTTPSLLTLHALLAMANQADIKALVLEVSSHGIAQERIAGLPFTAAIWTTIGRDHLEDHGGFEAYVHCKASFVLDVQAAGGMVVANADYPWIKQALADISKHVAWYGKHDAALNWARHQQNITFSDADDKIKLERMPVADFHAENLAAIVLLMQKLLKQPLQAMTALQGKISTPIGRLEPVNAQQQVFIDYAHTAEGLLCCLKSARKLTSEQLLLVFGCGGDRDKAKRPEMGAVAEQYADQCWLTSDNPRSEKQADIATDVLQGMMADQVHVIDDRAQAIQDAVFALKAGDVLVVAGKGHESYMEVQGQRLPWSDKREALAALAKREVMLCS